jgi:hypothetical protein
VVGAVASLAVVEERIHMLVAVVDEDPLQPFVDEDPSMVAVVVL